MNIYTKFARALIPLAITVATLACNSVGQIPPTPKPAPIGQTKTVELSTDILLTDVFGDDAVGIDQDGDLWLMNTRTGDSRQLTGDGHPKWGAALSADYVAWIDQRRMIQLPGYPPNTPIFSSDVFVRNRHTGEERRITDAPASRHALGMSGARLVWQDNRKGLLEDRRWDFDIYAYDLDHDLEIQVAVTPGRQEMPAIHGDTVVWTHNPNPPARGTAKPGSTTKPDNRFDIYSYNLATDEKRPLVETGDYNWLPSIYSELVVWQRFREKGKSDIVLLDLGTGEQAVIGEGGRREARPLISEDHVVWAVKETCDVGGIGIPRSKVRTGVYAYGLKTGEMRQFSSDKEPRTLLHGDVALVTEGCHMVTRQYAVPLD